MKESSVPARIPLSIALLACSVLLIFAFTLAVSWGAIPIPFNAVWAILLKQTLQLDVGIVVNPMHADIVWTLRTPRVVLAALVGAGLSLAGVAAQALVRNPLADPYVLGVSAGAALGAVASIVIGLGAFGVSSTSGAAFLGALVAIGLVLISAERGGVISPLRLILAGVAIGHLLEGLTSFLVLRAEDAHQVYGILFWLAGSLAQSNWRYLWLPAAGVLVGVLFLLIDGQKLNALLVGDETAASLGVDVIRLRQRLLALTALLTALMVALSGAIGFVGLVVPHIAWLFVGSDHRRVVPVATVFGAAFLIIADTIARLLLAPVEIPVGIVTGIFGAPFFLWLLWRSEHVARGVTMKLQFDEVKVQIGPVKIVHGVSFRIEPGEVAGVIGPNGSGKSTLLRTAYRHLRPVAGVVYAGDEDAWQLSSKANALRVAAVPQEQSSEFDFTVREMVEMGRIPHASLLGAPVVTARVVMGAMARVGIADFAERPFVTLSGGERQRVLLARALAQETPILVLDEPTNHLDIRHQLELLALLRALRLTTVIAIHDLNLAAAYCDRLHLMNQGQLVASGPPAAVLTSQQIAEVFGVGAEVEHDRDGGSRLRFRPLT